MTALHRLLEPARDRRTLLALAFVASGLPLGIAWFVLLVTGWSLGLGLAITLLGLPILIALGAACHAAAALERSLANTLLGAGARRPAKRPVPRGILARLRDWVTDRAVWRAQAYMLLRFVLGLPAAVAVLAVAFAGGGLAALPFYYWTGDVEVVAVWDVDALWEALLWVPVGVAILAVAVPWLIRGIALAWTPLVRALLDGRAAPEPAPAPVAAPAGPLSVTRRSLAVHASITAALALGLAAIWTATTPGEYFWPAWPLLALALLLGGHALVVLRRPGVPRNRRGLEIHAGLAALVNLFLIGVWLMSTPGDYFWPVWTIVGLGAPVAVHAGLILLGATEREEMAERIDVLTTTRSGAVDAAGGRAAPHRARPARRRAGPPGGAGAWTWAWPSRSSAPTRRARRGAGGRGPRGGQAGPGRAARPGPRHPPGGAHRPRPRGGAVVADRHQRPAGRPGGRRSTGARRRPSRRAAYFIVAEALANAAKHSARRRACACAWSASATCCGSRSPTTGAAAPTRRGRGWSACADGSRRSTGA